jgi:hypothetical protein
VVGDQVGDPVRGHLVGDREHVHQVLDGEVTAVLGGAQERDGGRLGDQHRGGEVVRLDPLPEEVGEVPRRAVAEQEVPEGLQDDRPRRVVADRLLLEVDPAGSAGRSATAPSAAGRARTGPRSRGWRPPTAACPATGRRPRSPPGRARGGRLLDLGEVVAALAHRAAQRGVGRPRLLGGRGRLGALRAQLAGQRDQVLEDVGRHPGADAQLGQAEARVGRVALRLLQGDLQLGAAARRLLLQQLGTGTPRAAASCSTSDSRGSRLPFSISDSTDGVRPTRAPRSARVRPLPAARA